MLVAGGLIVAASARYLVATAIGRPIGWKWLVAIAVWSAVASIAVLWACRAVSAHPRFRRRPAWLAAVILPASAVACVAALVLGAGVSSSSRGQVVPPDLSTIRDSAEGAPAEQKIRDLLIASSAYSVHTWFDEKFVDQTEGEPLDFGGVEEADIRPSATTAFYLAVAVQTGALESDQAEKVATGEVAVTLIDSLAATHYSNVKDGWSGATSWQGALWGELTAFAGWLMWDDLTPETRNAVTNLVTTEANRFIDYEVPYWKSPDGTEQFEGDSKAEENSWNSMLLQVAMAMVPDDLAWGRWNDKNTELMLSSFATPDDEASTELFDGRPLKDWLNGSNIENDGRVYNHQILHPDYMTTIMHNMHMVITTRLAGKSVPAASLHNVDLMWDAMTAVDYQAPPFQAPGGTIYDAATQQLYYPDGTDWGTSRRMNFAGFDAFYWAFGGDATRRDEAAAWLDTHATQALEMQARFSDGRTYGPEDDDTYPGREQWVGLYAAWSYLALQIGQDFEVAD